MIAKVTGVVTVFVIADAWMPVLRCKWSWIPSWAISSGAMRPSDFLFVLVLVRCGNLPLSWWLMEVSS